MASSFPPGTAAVKAEFLVSLDAKPSADDDAAESGTNYASSDPRGDSAGSGRGSRKYSKDQKKAQRGANKGRRFGKVRDDLDLCYKVAQGAICEFGAECKFNHDVPMYLSQKPRDLRIPKASALQISPPYVPPVAEETSADHQYPCIDPETSCPVHNELGECKYGYKCRFLGAHCRKEGDGSLTLVKNEELQAYAAVQMGEMNFVGPEVQKQLRSKKYTFPIADAYLKKAGNQTKHAPQAVVIPEPEQEPVVPSEATISERTGGSNVEAAKDSPDARTRYPEKKRLDWAGKTYLAPLTTAGNLPFRRLCVNYGADITCGEMGLANSFLSGSKEEWSLVRRHPSEKTFGVQVAGNKPNTLVPTAEVIANECAGGVDFVDINCGCPIDLVFNSGCGSALLDAPGKLGRIIIGMNKALGEIPVTVKLRTGVKDSKNTAHNLMPRLSTEFHAGGITLHGRTRQQRYTKLADWDYIKQCVEAVRAREADEDLPRVPIFGGGDCFSSQDYWEHIEQSGVDGVMIGRGALIKPWIFTEVKERREWDISSRERLDLIRDYAEFGLGHFGSDTAGVNATRRYLCEALSFQYRYVPIGILERLPGRINDRAPQFRGRDELETLLASPDSNDWVKISEMFLGPAPASWVFTPKHKSNAYESQG